MRKIMTITLAMALVFMAANAYACGNKANTDATKASMTSNDAACQPDAKAAKAETAKSGDAKVMTTEAKGCPSMKSTSDDAAVKKTDAAGSCCPAKSGTTKASSKAASAEAPQTKDSQPVMLMGNTGGIVEK